MQVWNIKRGARMKLNAVITCAAAIFFLLLSSNICALESDPNWLPSWIAQTETTRGDDGGWVDIDFSGIEQGKSIIGDLRFYLSQQVLIYFLPEKIDKVDNSQENQNEFEKRGGMKSN